MTLEECINILANSNAEHVFKLNTKEEVAQWLKALLWSVTGFKQTINEE